MFVFCFATHFLFNLLCFFLFPGICLPLFLRFDVISAFYCCNVSIYSLGLVQHYFFCYKHYKCVIMLYIFFPVCCMHKWIAKANISMVRMNHSYVVNSRQTKPIYVLIGQMSNVWTILSICSCTFCHHQQKWMKTVNDEGFININAKRKHMEQHFWTKTGEWNKQEMAKILNRKFAIIAPLLYNFLF